jgi:hypothetical protein
MMKDNLDRYFCISVDPSICKGGKIYLKADYVQIGTDGSVRFMKNGDDVIADTIIFSVASGKWISFYVASQIDGGACCVEHWEGEDE